MRLKLTSTILTFASPSSKLGHFGTRFRFKGHIQRNQNQYANVTANYYSTTSNPNSAEPFSPKKVLILTKLSRYEFEKLRHPNLPNDQELEQILRKRGSDYNTLLYHHYIHKGCEFRVVKAFQDFGVETRLVNRFNYTEENIHWADLIVTTGGDGTFLMAACRIQNRLKPIVGFNTDPTRSIGYLCLPKKYSINVQDAVNKLFENRFQWTFRRRIRITLIGESVFEPPIELHDQQLSHPEYRFFECFTEQQHKSAPLTISEELQNNSKLKKRVLPVLALNEVYLGECVSARVSYFEVGTDRQGPPGERVKSKNAGICVSTGTGSTSWSHNISKISPETVKGLLKVLDEELKLNSDGDSVLNQLSSRSLSTNPRLVDKVTDNFNAKLVFEPDSNEMLYTIRDPVSSYTLPCATEIVPRAFVKRMEIKSRCFDACMVIDGGLSFSFNDGTMVILEMWEEDALKTIVEMGDGDDIKGGDRSFGA